MVTLARISQDNQLTVNEVLSASKVAAGMSAGIEKEKAMATFIGQATLAMKPKVRGYVQAMVHVRDMAWDAEDLALQEDKTAPKPLHKAFARRYHCLFAMFKLADEGRVIETPRELIMVAHERDPDFDIEKVEKRLKAIAKELHGFWQDWPVDDIQSCIEVLNDIKTKELKASRVNTTRIAPELATPTLSLDSTATNGPDQEPENEEPESEESDVDQLLGA